MLGGVTGGLESWPGEFWPAAQEQGQKMWPDARVYLEKPNSKGCPEYVQLGVYTRVDMERTFRKFIEAIHFSLLRPQSLGATVVYI